MLAHPFCFLMSSNFLFFRLIIASKVRIIALIFRVGGVTDSRGRLKKMQAQEMDEQAQEI